MDITRAPDSFYQRLEGQMDSGAFRAITEVYVWHAGIGKFQEIRINFDDDLFLAAFKEAKRKSWPFTSPLS